MQELRVQRADITALNLDAIVNAANERLLGGGGVDGAIHRAAGPELLAACRQLPEVSPGIRCPTGESRLTPGFLLPARFVIHTVGPVWTGGESGEPRLLAACYRSVFDVAERVRIRSLAFPAVSCGIFGYPLDLAAGVAVREARDALARAATLELVVLVAFDAAMERVLTNALAASAPAR